jgi:sterol desaturase/sphingolipid hydroxylase (fatty acid hydroxylase superfamily)
VRAAHCSRLNPILNLLRQALGQQGKVSRAMFDALYLIASESAARTAHYFLSPTARNGLIALIIGWAIGLVAWRLFVGQHGFSLGGYLRYAFPARVYASRSFAVDLQVFVFTMVTTPLRWAGKLLSVAATAVLVASGLAALFGPMAPLVPGAGGVALMAVLLLLAYDLGTYIAHRLSHRVPVLWAFHRLHHSAEELNPLTVERKHPVYSLFSLLIDCALVAPVQGVVLFLFGQETSFAAVAGSNIGFAIFAYCAASLRHTHIWVSWGPVLSHLFVSPAMHQIHHSRAERHFDRNYGEVLAIWDWAFGSIYVPATREELVFGLGDEAHQPHPNLLAALLEPFGYAWRALRTRRGPDRVQPEAANAAAPSAP